MTQERLPCSTQLFSIPLLLLPLVASSMAKTFLSIYYQSAVDTNLSADEIGKQRLLNGKYSDILKFFEVTREGRRQK